MLDIASEATYCVSENEKGERLDQFLVAKGTDLSRARIQTLIKDGYVKVNDRKVKCSYRVRYKDNVHLVIPVESSLEIKPEYVDFEIIYEDKYIVVIDKPPGLVIHPAPGHYQGTLVHGLLYRCKDLSGIGGVLRPGIVHRLDKDTSGIMLIAKNDFSHRFLTEQFKSGIIEKEYWALIYGYFERDMGIIDLPIARHPINRKKMSVSEGGKKAVTVWYKLSEFNQNITLVSIFPKTGRTHQIRVHMSHVGHPIVGDSVYGRKNDLYASRQMLHARRISFYHPVYKERIEFSSNLSEDIRKLLFKLNKI